jgi:4-hydroxybenzoate polyprenyltransferase
MIWLSVARPHILAIVFMSTVTYGWIMGGAHTPTLLLVALVAVWDWFIVNFMNKATDVDEDLANGIAGADLVQRHRGRVELIGLAMMVLGLALGHLVLPQLWPFRLAFTLIGLGYNYRIVPAPLRDGSGRWRLGLGRFKELYFFKNFGSSVLFTLSVFYYPLYGTAADYPALKLWLAILFFIPLELTYEILYDLRDLSGDRAQGVPTYPVVHGPDVAKRIILGLLMFSAVVPVVGAVTGVLRLREWVVVAGVLQQLVLVRLYAGGARLPTSAEAVRITWIGAAQLASYNLWVAVGLPLGA